MDDLVRFLKAQLDDIEQVARAVQDNSSPFTGRWKADGEHALRTYNDWVLACLPGGKPFRPGVLEHIVRHDPAHVLAKVAADRQIIIECEQAVIEGRADGRAVRTQYAVGQYMLAMRTLRLLALPYVDHADYQEAWRP